DGGGRGRAYGVGRVEGHRRVPQGARIRVGGVQGPAPDAAAVEPAAAPAHPAERRPHGRVGLAAGRLFAPGLRAGYARRRSTGEQMQARLMHSNDRAGNHDMNDLATRTTPTPSLSGGGRSKPHARRVARGATGAANPLLPPKGGGIRWGSRAASLVLAFALALAFVTRADAYLAYVSNEKGNTVSIIDTAKLEVVKTIKVG